jgi:hypothetical protein
VQQPGIHDPDDPPPPEQAVRAKLIKGLARLLLIAVDHDQIAGALTFIRQQMIQDLISRPLAEISFTEDQIYLGSITLIDSLQQSG